MFSQQDMLLASGAKKKDAGRIGRSGGNLGLASAILVNRAHSNYKCTFPAHPRNQTALPV
jgi:hypothetical protein